MCLDLDGNWRKLTKEFKSRKEPIKVYKVVDAHLMSPFNRYEWKYGLNKSGRWWPWVGYFERDIYINKGFHFFTRLTDARHLLRFLEREQGFISMSILECSVKPNHIVAVGYFGHNEDINIVARKATMNKILTGDDINRIPAEEIQGCSK